MKKTLIALAIAGLAFTLPTTAEEAKPKEEKITMEQVPAKVRKAFEKDHPNVKPAEVEKETYADGTIHYEFEWKDKEGKKHEAEYNADGEQLEEHEDEHGDHKH